MAQYQCPLCQEKMDRDVVVFGEHIEGHIIDEVKKQHPDWVALNGACPKCVEYFKKARKAR